MSNYSTLRIGPIESENSHSTTLRDAIISHYQPDDVPSLSTNLLPISNKYFTANVLLLGFNYTSAIKKDAIEDGIILLFDGTNSTSFDALSTHHNSALNSNKCGDLLRLCISITHGPSPLSDGTKQSETEYSRRVLWCLDHGYEYIEVDISDEGMKRGHNDRDKEGFARVVEAIGCCMWSSHVMKPRNNKIVSIEEEEGNNSTALANDDDVSNDNRDASTQSSALPDHIVSTLTDDEEREKDAMASLMKDGENNDSRPSETPEQQPRKDQKEEIAFHQLESVLSEAKSIRESSKSNSMSDDERRERAGETAMKLMGLLDSMGLGDDDDDSTDDDEG